MRHVLPPSSAPLGQRPSRSPCTLPLRSVSPSAPAPRQERRDDGWPAAIHKLPRRPRYDNLVYYLLLGLLLLLALLLALLVKRGSLLPQTAPILILQNSAPVSPDAAAAGPEKPDGGASLKAGEEHSALRNLAEGRGESAGTAAAAEIANSAAESSPATKQEILSSAASVSNGGTSGTDASGHISLNYSSREELLSVPGIGPVTADAILDLRSQLSRPLILDDLLTISGIKEKKFARLAPYFFTP